MSELAIQCPRLLRPGSLRRSVRALQRGVPVQRRMGEFPLVSLGGQLGELRAGVLARGDRRSGQAVGARAEGSPAAWDPWRRCAGRSAGGVWARAGFPQPVRVPVKAPHRRRLEVEREVHKVLWWAKRDWRGGVGERVSRRGWGRALERLLQQTSISGDSWLYLWRRGLPGWDGGRIVIRFGAALKQRGKRVTLDVSQGPLFQHARSPQPVPPEPLSSDA